MPGFIPDPESVKRVHQRDFQVAGGDTALTAIGQGDVLVTPLQMADFMAALANGGTVYRPRLAKDIEDRNGNVIKAFPTETLRTVTFDDKWMPDLKAAMINVVDDGTATVVHRDDMKIAAKTGTAQVGSKDPSPPDRLALRLSARRQPAVFLLRHGRRPVLRQPRRHGNRRSARRR